MGQKKVKLERSCHSSYSCLMTLLTQGWHIEPPVYVRPHWRRSAHSREEKTYHFVLWYGDKVSLVSVLECPEIQRFLAETGLIVDRL